MNLALWEWPQWIFVAWIVINLISGAASHGKITKFDFWTVAVRTIIIVTLLIFGGFFNGHS